MQKSLVLKKETVCAMDITKVLLDIIIGLATVFLIYPFLHEMGHFWAAKVTGVEVLRGELFPVPYVLCHMDVNNVIGVISTGLGGVLLPFIFTLRTPKKYWLWRMCFVMRQICVLAFGISLWAVKFFDSELQIKDDDMTRVMQYVPQYRWLFYLVLVLCGVVSLVQLIHSIVRQRFKSKC